MMRLFADYADEKWNWITAFDAKYYPDHFPEALELYSPVIGHFRELARAAKTSEDLLRAIQSTTRDDRIQLLRIFRRYVSPGSSVEMLKKKGNTDEICRVFGPLFRDIKKVRANLSIADYNLVLSVLLFEHKDRGNLGYELTEQFFNWFTEHFENPPYEALGPRRAGSDIELNSLPSFASFEHSCPCDIVIQQNDIPVLVGFARYDSDRGGSQEDDRTGGNRTKVLQILDYANKKSINVKILFINDGPGLLLGSMWRDYGELERADPKRILVTTLKMLPARLTEGWMTEGAGRTA
jgi:hypothetical protein